MLALLGVLVSIITRSYVHNVDDCMRDHMCALLYALLYALLHGVINIKVWISEWITSPVFLKAGLGMDYDVTKM